MRIAIDSHAAEQDGTGNCTYFRNLILWLSRLDSRNEYILLTTDKEHPFYRSLKDCPNFKILQIIRRPAWIRVFVSLWLESHRRKIDILHVQYFSPLIHKGRLVNTVHDLASYHHPKYFSLFERFLFKTLLPISSRKATRILTASEVSKHDLVTLMGIPSTAVKVTYCGVSEHFSNHQSDESLLEIRRRYGLKEKFLLSVGRIDPRKNLVRLIQAYSYLRSHYPVDHGLVIIGKNYLEPKALRQTVQESEYRNDIHFCGYVSDESLPAFYQAADVLIYTSEFEGFGLPPLEAMAAGTPVVASDISIFREILSDSAVLVNPEDIQEIAMAIHHVISNPEFQNEMREKGKARAKKYTWKNTAEITLQAYEEAMMQSS